MWDWLDALFSSGAEDYVGDLPLASDVGEGLFDVGDIGGFAYDLGDVGGVGDYFDTAYDVGDFGGDSYAFDAGDIGGVDFEYNLDDFAPYDQPIDMQAFDEAPMSSPDAYTAQRASERALFEGPSAPAPQSPVTRAASAVGDAAKKLGSAALRNPVQTALGAGAIGSVAAGLAKGTPETSMSPATREALNAVTSARQRAVSASQTGYAGEQAIRDEVNQQIMAALEGGASDEELMPDLVRRRDEALRAMEDQMRREMGSGFSISTAGANKLANERLKWEDLFTQERERRLATRNAMGAQRSQMARQQDLDPFNMAQVELGMLAGMDDSTQDRAAAERAALLGLGGNLAGVAVAPWMYDQMRRNYARVTP